MLRIDVTERMTDAKWFTREEVLAVLNHKSGTNFSRRDYKTLADKEDNRPNGAASNEGGAALAHSDPSMQAKVVEEKAKEANAAAAKDDRNDEPPFRVPPMTAIAGVLIRHWAEDALGAGANAPPAVPKGNL